MKMMMIVLQRKEKLWNKKQILLSCQIVWGGMGRIIKSFSFVCVCVLLGLVNPFFPGLNIRTFVGLSIVCLCDLFKFK